MSESIAPISTTTIVATTADRRSYREPARDAAAGPDAADDEDTASSAGVALVLPVQRAVSLEPTGQRFAGTLFAASVLGQRMRMLESHLDAMRLARGGQWAPPESALRLRDKTI